VNLNGASPADLATLVGVTAALAQQIIQNRPYADARDFIAKNGPDGGAIYQRMVSTAGVSLRY
jgi:DNA uptake protein ComE-like DNA-binding protein